MSKTNRSQGKSFFMMFDVVQGGIVEAIEFDKINFEPNRSIIILDEGNQTVWLWHGKRRALVPRRMALRQAQSIKGHGYQAGNAIIGRDLHKIIEIDARKIGRDPETTKDNDKIDALLDGTYNAIGNMVYTQGESGGKLESPKVEIKSQEKPKETPKPSTKSSQPVTSTPKPKAQDTKPIIKELPKSSPQPKPIDESPKETEATTIIQPDNEEMRKGAVIMAVLSQFKDLWISKKDVNTIALEQMDGKICSFKVEEGEIKFLPGSFFEIPKEKKDIILQKVEKI